MKYSGLKQMCVSCFTYSPDYGQKCKKNKKGRLVMPFHFPTTERPYY